MRAIPLSGIGANEMHGNITINSSDDNTINLIAAHRGACAIRDFAFAEIDTIDEDKEPQGLRDIASDITKSEGAIFAEMIGDLPTTAKGVTALIIYLEEVKQHPLGLWHLDEECAAVLFGKLAESVRLDPTTPDA
jgi:hypothetical protein